MVILCYIALRLTWLSTPPQWVVYDNSTKQAVSKGDRTWSSRWGSQTFDSSSFHCNILRSHNDDSEFLGKISKRISKSIKHFRSWFYSSRANRYQLKYVTLISSQLRRCLIIFDMFFEIFSTSESVMRAFRAENCVDRAPRPLAKWSFSCQSSDYSWCSSCHLN